ncbi:hypothetical protein [Mesorhizobium captivum]|uniref:hypothetical protein n=1 Tax=Mesorhizobium captivum TaxID=3072319 RepID=UPI002A244109|nr:hypothetical protein [Mesorhizobium sp. VK3C]MDX8448162.1 hypothetical protein [Mesorhizobium sp. VK3C]
MRVFYCCIDGIAWSFDDRIDVMSYRNERRRYEDAIPRSPTAREFPEMLRRGSPTTEARSKFQVSSRKQCA